MGLKISDGCLNVFIEMVRVVFEVFDLLGEFEELGGCLFRRRAGPGNGLDGSMPPFIEKISGFPLEETPAIGSSGKVGGGVAVAALGDEQEKSC